MRSGIATIVVFAVASMPTAAGAATTASPQIPHQPTQHQKRIIGGGPDRHNDTGWVASVVRRTHKTTELCGGSLIASRYVITAAHCIRNASRGQLTVRLGSKHWNRGGVVRGVDRIFVYPRFNPRTLYGDLSVVKLARPVNLGPASLVSPGTSYVTNPPTEAYIAGWGATRRDGSGHPPSSLYSTWVSLLPDRNCGSGFQGSVEICAGAQGRDTCFGDSGGPLAVWDGSWWQLVGVTSYGWGNKCGHRNSAYAWIGSPRLHRWLTGS